MRTYAIVLVAALAVLGCEKKDKKNNAKNKPKTTKTTTTPKATAKAKPNATLKATPDKPASPEDMLKNPSLAKMTAPDKFKAKFTTTKGDFVIDVTRAWAPNGADRFYTMVKIGYFKDIAFFRAVKNFMVQFGIHGDPSLAMSWLRSNIQDDPVVKSNTRGYVTFAKASMPNSRSVQVFINYVDRNKQLDRMGFAPFGFVNAKGMKVIDSLYTGYGESTTRRQSEIAQKGNTWLKQQYPQLDYIKSAEIVEPAGKKPADKKAADKKPAGKKAADKKPAGKK